MNEFGWGQISIACQISRFSSAHFCSACSNSLGYIPSIRNVCAGRRQVTVIFAPRRRHERRRIKVGRRLRCRRSPGRRLRRMPRMQVEKRSGRSTWPETTGNTNNGQRATTVRADFGGDPSVTPTSRQALKHPAVARDDRYICRCTTRRSPAGTSPTCRLPRVPPFPGSLLRLGRSDECRYLPIKVPAESVTLSPPSV